MTKKIIKYYIILLVIFFSWVGVANASDVVINEFVSNPNTNEKEWIELKNNDTKSIDLSGFKLTELSSPTTVPKENNLMSLSGTIDDILVFEIKSSSLNDSGDSIGLYDGDTLVDRVTYGKVVGYTSDLSAPSKGKSGALISSWVTNQEPTKNSPNSDSSDNSSDNSSEDNTMDETVDPAPLIKEDSVILKITTKITSPKIVTAGIPFSLSSLTTTNRGEAYAVGKFVWNFGDGMVRGIGEANPFEYTYQYPGDYALTLSYYDSTFSTVPDATDRMTIKAVPAGINISSVGNASDPFVEIENKSSYEIILSKWVVTAGIHYFIIPEGTTLLPSKKIKLSPKITGFVGEDLSSIVISNGSKEIIATYPIQIIKPIQKIASINKTANSNPVPADNPQDTPDTSLLKEPQVINLNDLGPSAENTGINISSPIYPLVGLLVVIGLGVASFLLIKRKRNVGDYVEQGISAKDMTIVE